MTDRSRHQSNQKTGNARRGNANASIQAGNNLRNLPLNNAINKIAKTVTKVGTTSVNQVSKPKVDNLPNINTSNVPKSPLERLGLENRAFSGGFNIKDFQGKTSGTVFGGLSLPNLTDLKPKGGNPHRRDYYGNLYKTGSPNDPLRQQRHDERVAFHDAQFNPNSPFEIRTFTGAGKSVNTVCAKVTYDPKLGVYKDGYGNVITEKEAVNIEIDNFMKSGIPSDWFNNYLNTFEGIISGLYSITMPEKDREKWVNKSKYEADFYNADKRIIESKVYFDPKANMPSITEEDMVTKLYRDKWWNSKKNEWRKDSPEPPVVPIYGKNNKIIGWERTSSYVAPSKEEYEAFCKEAERAWKIGKMYLTKFNENEQEATEIAKHTAGTLKGTPDSLFDSFVRTFFKVSTQEEKKGNRLAFETALSESAKASVDYFKTYFCNPMINGRVSSSFYNGLYNFGECLDYFAYGGRALASSQVNIKYNGNHSYEGQVDWLYSGGYGDFMYSDQTLSLVNKYKGVKYKEILKDKSADQLQNEYGIKSKVKREDYETDEEYDVARRSDIAKQAADIVKKYRKVSRIQKRLFELGAGELMTPSSRAGLKDKSKIIEAIKNDKSIKGVDLWAEFEQLRRDWAKADKFDKPLSRIGKAYTDFDSDYLPDTGSLAKDTSLYMLTDPSIILTLGTSAAAKVGAKGLGGQALRGVQSSISKDAYKLTLDMFNKEARYLEKKITTLSVSDLSQRADDFAQMLIDNNIIHTVDKEHYVNLYYNGFKNMQSTRNYKIISSLDHLYRATEFMDRAFLVGGLYLPSAAIGAAIGSRVVLHKAGKSSKIITGIHQKKSDNSLRAFKRVSGADDRVSILDLDVYIDSINKEMEGSVKYDKKAFILFKNGAAKDRALINELIDIVVNNPKKLSVKHLKKYVNKQINRGIVSRTTGDSCTDLKQLKTVLIEKSKNIGKSIDAEKILDDFIASVDRLETALNLAGIKDVEEWTKAVKSAETLEDLKWLYIYYATNIDNIDDNLEKIFLSRAEFFNSKIKGSPDLRVRPFDMEAFVKFEKQRLGHTPVNKVDKASHDVNLDSTKCEVTENVPGVKPHVKKLIDNLKDTFRLIEDNARDAKSAREEAGIPFGKNSDEHIIDKPDVAKLLYFLGKIDDSSAEVDVVELAQRVVKVHNSLDNDYQMSAGIKDELFKADPAYGEYYTVTRDELPPLYNELADLTNRLDDADVDERISLKKEIKEVRTKKDDAEKRRKLLREQLLSIGKMEEYRIKIGTYNRLHSDTMRDTMKILRKSFETLRDTISGVVEATDDLAPVNVGKNKVYIDYITDKGWKVIMSDIVDSSSDFGMFVADRDAFRELINIVEEQAIKENKPVPEMQTIRAMYNDLCVVSDQAEAYTLFTELLNNIKYDTRLSTHQKEVMYEFLFESSKNSRFGNYVYKLRDPKVISNIKNQMLDSSHTTSLDLESAKVSMTSSVDSLDSVDFYSRYEAEEVAESLELADEIVKENTSLALAQYIVRDKDAIDTLNGFVDDGYKVLILDAAVFDADSGVDAIGSISVREYSKIESTGSLSDVFSAIQNMPFRDDFISKLDEETVKNVTYDFLKDYYAHDPSKNLNSEEALRQAFYDEWLALRPSEVVSDLDTITKFVDYLDSIDGGIKIVVHDPDNKMSGYLSKRLRTASSKKHVRVNDLFNDSHVFNMYDMLRVSEASKNQEVITPSTIDAITEHITTFRSGLEGKVNPVSFDPVMFISALNRIKNKIKGINLRFDIHAALDPEYLTRIEAAPEGYAKYYSKEAYLLDHKFTPDITRDRNLLDKMFMSDSIEYSKAEHDTDVRYDVYGNEVNIETSPQDVGYAFMGTDSEYMVHYCPELGRYSEGRRNTSDEIQKSYKAILASDNFVDAKSYDPRVKRILDRMTNVTQRDVFEAKKYRLEKELSDLERELVICNDSLEEAYKEARSLRIEVPKEARRLRIKAQKRGLRTVSDTGFWLELGRQNFLNDAKLFDAKNKKKWLQAEKRRLENKIRDTKAGINRLTTALETDASLDETVFDAVAKHKANKEYGPRYLYLDTDYEFTDLFDYFDSRTRTYINPHTHERVSLDKNAPIPRVKSGEPFKLAKGQKVTPETGKFRFTSAYTLRKSAVEPVVDMLTSLRDALASKLLHLDSNINFLNKFTYENRVYFDSVFSDHIEKMSMDPEQFTGIYPEQFTDCLIMFRDTINFFFDNFDNIFSRMDYSDLFFFVTNFRNLLEDLSKRLITYEPNVLFRYLDEFTEYRDSCFVYFEKLHSVLDHNAVYSKIPKYFYGTTELTAPTIRNTEDVLSIEVLNNFITESYTVKDIFALEKFIPDLPYSIGSCLQSAITLAKSLDYYGDYFTYELKAAFNEAFTDMIKATKEFINEVSENLVLFNTGTPLDGISFNRDRLPAFMQRLNNKMADCNNVFSNIHCTIVDSFDKTKLGDIGRAFPSLSKAKDYFESLKGTAAVSNCDMLRKKYNRTFKLQNSTLINAERYDGVGDIATLTDKPIAGNQIDVATFSGQEAQAYVPNTLVVQKEEASLVDKCFKISEKQYFPNGRITANVGQDNSAHTAISKEFTTKIAYRKKVKDLEEKYLSSPSVPKAPRKALPETGNVTDPISHNQRLEFSKRFDRLVNKTNLNTDFLAYFSKDFKPIITMCSEFASRLDVTHPYYYLSELKVPETLKEQYVMARILYEIIYVPLKMSKEQQSKQFLSFIDNLSAERRASMYALNIKGTEFSDELDKIFPTTWLFDSRVDDLIFKAKDRWTKESNIGMADWQVLRLDDPGFILANAENIRQESQVYDTWASRLGNSSTSARDKAVHMFGENLQDLQVMLSNSYKKNPESFRLYRSYLDSCQRKMTEVWSLQIMDYISKSADNLINHLVFHNQLLVVSKNGSDAYLSYLAKLDELFKDAPDMLVRKETDEFMFIGLSRDTQIMVSGDDRMLMYKGKLYDKVFSEKDLVDHYARIELPKPPTGCEELYKMLKNCYDNLDYLTEGTIRGSMLAPYTQAKHRAVWRRLPNDFKRKIIKGNATCDDLLFKRAQFDFSLIGDTEHAYKANLYDDTDILHNLNKCYEDLVGTISTERMYISNFFDENCHSRLEVVLKGLTDEEQLQVLKDLPDQCVVTLREGSSRTGFNVHKLKIRDTFDLKMAKIEKAIIVPYDIYVEMTRLINQSSLSKTYLKVWAQLVFFLKVGHLCNPGTWMRNWVDATIKASGETGSVRETAIGQLKAMQLLHDYNNICKIVKKLNGDYKESLESLERSWANYQKQAKVKITFDEFQFLESWLKVSLSGGESRLLSEFLKRESKNHISRKNLKIGDTSTVKGRVAAQESFDVVGGDIPRFEALGQEEILHLIDLCEKDGRQKYKLFDDSFTKEEFLEIFNNRLADVDYIVDTKLFDKYSAVADTLLRKRNTLWSKTPRGTYNSIDHLCSMCLKPMSKIEQVVRLGQYLTLESQGYTKSQIFKSIADTQFEYQLKSSKLKYAELGITYANFEYMNMKYWLNQLETNPSFMYTLGRLWGGLSWEPCRSYTSDEEYYNNQSVMYMMTHGAVPIGNKGLYLKMFPSALGALNWFFGLPSQYMQAVVPPLENLSKDLFYLMGGAFASVVEDTDYNYKDQETWEKILNNVPIAGTIYTRYIQHFKDRRPWYRLPEGSFGRVLAASLPTVFGAAAIYNQNEASSFEDFQEDLAKQGKWYDCNLSRVVPLSQKNNIGLNKDWDKQSWDELKQNMFKYKGQFWDQNWFGFKDGEADYGHFTSFGDIYFNEDGTYKERGLNQNFDFRQDGVFDVFEDLEWKYHGRKWDNNTRKLVPGNLWKKEGLNKDFDFEHDPNAWFEWNYELNKHGYYYDMKSHSIKKLKKGEEWHLNQYNYGYYHRGWREFKRWATYGNRPPALRKLYHPEYAAKPNNNKVYKTVLATSGNYSALRMATAGYKSYNEYYSFDYNYNYSYRNPNPRAGAKRYNPILRYHIIPK